MEKVELPIQYYSICSQGCFTVYKSHVHIILHRLKSFHGAIYAFAEYDRWVYKVYNILYLANKIWNNTFHKEQLAAYNMYLQDLLTTSHPNKF